MSDEQLKLPKLTKRQIWMHELAFWFALGCGLSSANTFTHSHKDADLIWGFSMLFCMWINYMVLHVVPRE